MRKTSPVSRVVVLLIIAGTTLTARPSGQRAGTPEPAAVVAAHRALLDRYCVTCHSERVKAAGLVLQGLSLDQVPAATETWEKVLHKVRTGAMPPAGLPRPDRESADRFRAWLETTLDHAAAVSPDPGRPSIHRLNRTEYVNAIRDVLALDVLDGASLLPSDDASYGFDNIGEVLTMTPGLLSRYLLAAKKISRLAVGDSTIHPSVATYSLPMSLVQDTRMSEELPFGTRGGLSVRHVFPVDGTYSIKVRLHRNGLALGENVRGLADENLIDVMIDGERVTRFTIGGRGEGRVRGTPGTADTDLEVRFPAKAGTRSVGVAFVDQFFYMEGVSVSRLPAGSDGFAAGSNTSVNYGKVQMAVESIAVAGPFDVPPVSDTPSRRRVFICRPAGARDEEACAERILSTLARRAYRRPVTADDTRTLMEFFRNGQASGGFDQGIQTGLERMLVAPSFLFRVEDDPPRTARGAAYTVSDIELASRLSFFLWSSVPDDALLAVAERGQLKNPAVLEREVRRMLADPRANALVTNFFSQWLLVRNMDAVKPDTYAFPDFDDNLRQAFKQETKLFIESQLHEDRSVLDLLSADYTFVNERLARHYGIPGIYGSHFRRVQYTDDRRAGLLGQGSILTVTSYANRTSPVVRGKWIMETLLGTPPPAPPPGVPTLDESNSAAKAKPKSVREQMENHRKNPNCSGCHSRMDPLGFALENFDGIGAFRETEGTSRIDPSGAFPGGAMFSTPREFRQGLLTQRDEIVETIAEKLLTYALGRGVEAHDLPAVRAITRAASVQGYRWSALFLAIVKSTPFQMRRTES
jgi:mono/diheme cytochrome c family protein